MKKFLYSILALGLSLTSCADFNDENSQNYGEGPAISISVDATADSTFTFTLTPASGTQYYSYLVAAGTEAEEVDGETLLKVQYSGVDGACIKAADNATSVVTETNLDPATSYVIYAVAASDKGTVGTVATQVVTTTDIYAPEIVSVKRDGDNKTITATFSDDIVRGSGAVTARYLSEYSGAYTTIEPTVTVSGNSVAFTASDAPAGSYVFFDFEAGAFLDGSGNACGAFSSGINSQGQPSGVYFHTTQVPFAISEDGFSGVGSMINSSFVGTCTFDFDVYRNDDAVEAGDVTLVYKNSNRTTTYSLTASQWSVSGNTLTFNLPASPASGDQIYIEVKDGAIADVNGNPNIAFSSENVYWNYYSLIYGTYQYTDAYGDEGTFELIATGNENEFVINGMLGLTEEGGQTVGTFDPATGTLSIAAWYTLGTVTLSSGDQYLAVIYPSDGESDYCTFTLGAGGVFTSDNFNVVAATLDFSSLVGYLCKAPATFAPVTAASKAKATTRAYAATRKFSGVKVSKMHKVSNRKMK